MKTCASCGFVDVPGAQSCLRCDEVFPVVPALVSDEHSEAFYLLDDLAQACMAGELTIPQRDSTVTQLLKLIDAEEQRFLAEASKLASPLAQENLKLIQSGLATMASLLREAQEADVWSLEEWTAWLEDAGPADILVRRGAQELDREANPPPLDSSLNPLLARAKWIQAAADEIEEGENIV